MQPAASRTVTGRYIRGVLLVQCHSAPATSAAGMRKPMPFEYSIFGREKEGYIGFKIACIHMQPRNMSLCGIVMHPMGLDQILIITEVTVAHNTTGPHIRNWP